MTKTAFAVPALLTFALAAPALAAASCSSSDHPESTHPLSTSATSSGHGGSGGSGGGGGAGAQGGEDSGAPPICDPKTQWGMGTKIAGLSTSEDDLFGSITPDELTIAWMTPGMGGVVHYADRKAATDPFGAPQTLAATAGYYAFDRAALSADGLRLAVLTTDHHAIAEATRAKRTDAFGPPADSAAFQQFNEVGQNFSINQGYADILFSSDDLHLFYTQFSDAVKNTVIEAARMAPADTWPSGQAFTAPELQAMGHLRRHATGLASDKKTLFYWDEQSSTEHAGWRKGDTGEFSGFVDLGAKRGAQPNDSCKRLYYSAPGPNGDLELFTSDGT